MKQTKLIYLLSLLLIFSGITKMDAVNRYSVAAGGAWNNNATWSTVCGGVGGASFPVAGDVVEICGGTVTIPVNSACATLLVRPGATLSYSGTAILTTTGNVTIDGTFTFTLAGGAKSLVIGAGRSLTLNGTINMTGNEGDINVGAGSFFLMNAGSSLIWDPNNTAVGGATLFTNTTETFAATSSITFLSWYNSAVPLGSVVSGNFGNITCSRGGVWDQDGQFAPARIKGTLTITSGQLNMDDGTGATTALTVQDVVTSGTGAIVFQSGANRNLTLVTGALTHNGSGLCSMMYQSGGVLNWTANGNVAVSGPFTAIQGAAAAVASTCNMTVNGAFTVSGTSLFDINRGLDGTNSPATIVITGACTISSTGWFRCIDAGDGALNFTANSIAFSNTGNSSIFKSSIGAPGAVAGGNATVTITNDFSIATNAEVYILGDMGCFSGPFAVPCTDGAGAAQATSLSVGGAFSADISANNLFKGICVSGTGTAGTFTGNFGSINWTGGDFIPHDGNHTGTGSNTINVTGDFVTTFTNAGDNVILVNNINSAGTPNTIKCDLTVGGNLTTSGSASPFWISSGAGDETVDVTGNITLTTARQWFVGTATAGNDHDITGTVGGNVQINSGEFLHSAQTGIDNWTVNGNYTIAGGTSDLKVEDGSSVSLLVQGAFSQTGGTFSVHGSTTVLPTSDFTVTVNGDFSHTGGTFDFESHTTSTRIHKLYLNGANYTLNNSGIISHIAGAGTSANFGEMYFNRAGTITFNRASTTHQINQVRQIIVAGCTVDAAASTNDIQISCNSSAGVTALPPTVRLMEVNGVLIAGTKLIFGRGESATDRPTSFTVNSGGELRTANTLGMYDGTTSATFVNRTRDNGNVNHTLNSFNWSLDANSTVRYNAAANQTVTGKFPTSYAVATISDVASGSTAQYKYGKLQIDNQGTVGTNYAFPAIPGAGTGNVFVRTQLICTTGELNLAGSGTGQTITVENGANDAAATPGIIRTAGYIKSEEVNAGNNRAKVQWNIGGNTGAHTFPFGLYSGSIQYLPVNFNTSGASGNITASTRSTLGNANNTTGVAGQWCAATNVAAVTSMADSTSGGATDGSTVSVIDRWWDFISSVGGAIPAATVTFTYRGEENTLTGSPTGPLAVQHWNGTTWDQSMPTGIAGSTVAGPHSVTKSGLTSFSPYILVSALTPLPIELISFTANLNVDAVALSWITAAEVNNDYFTVEKSVDGLSFTEVLKVDGAGNSTGMIDYFDIDRNPYVGISYYRLKQTDYDGKTSYSNIVPVEYNPNGDPTISLFPNPSDVGTTTYLSLNQFEGGEVLVVLRDITGREIFSKVVIASSGNELIVLNENGSLAKGSYLVTATSKNKFYNKKLIVK